MARDEAMSNGAATAERREQLAREGWCVVPDVIGREEAAAADARVWAVIEANRRDGITTELAGIDPNDRNVRALNLIEGDPLFRAMVQHETALEMVAAVIGPDFCISNFTANIALPGSGSMPLHSDQSFVAPQPWAQPWSVNIIWCLTDVHAANGATCFIPGSHLWRTRADVPADAHARLTPFEAKAGSIVVMEGRVWHTSGANVTADEERCCLFGYYSASFLRAQVNWNVALSEDVKAGMSDRMKAWLGLDLLPNFPESFIIQEGKADFATASAKQD
jgi:ectoine hydroxylase-related dioxygenase (phytanoyl-CoA dioxygenase family)